ncbi:MAG: fumarate hydratase [Oscillospiraceae bacterium]|jgi:fumarate hydratase subunit alpha|nr:fumarate hydratase [Oscillospiraceae bacterium]
MTREIDVSVIRDATARLFVEANVFLPEGTREILLKSAKEERSPLCAGVLRDLVRNMDEAERKNIPVCQDTGMAVVFLEIGQDVRFTGGNLYEAVNEGVAMGYRDGCLRKSVASDPIFRENTGDNTPAIIHAEITAGDKAVITAAPKGFGSENMSAVKMFPPTASIEDIIAFVTETVSKAGSNPCPPIIAGVGIGGDFEYAAILAKKALCRGVNARHPDKRYSDIEERMLSEINRLGIGAQGFGGTVTALSVNIERFPTHIAGLPVAVNIGCHVTRHRKAVI